MFHDSDFEFFQELDPLYCDPAREGVVQTIDFLKKTEEKALNIDTTHNTFPPQGWEQFGDVNSALPQTSFYNITPNGPLSPNDKFVQFDNNILNLPEMEKNENNLYNQEKTLDISSLPMVFEDLTSENATDINLWQSTAQVEWINPSDSHFNLINTNTLNTDPFINTDDSLDLKFDSVIPRKVEINLSRTECNIDNKLEYGAMEVSTIPKRGDGLSVDVFARAPVWPGEISTPVILSQVISLEKENTENLEPPDPWQSFPTEVYSLKTSPKVDYEPITPKSECHAGSDNDDSKSSSTSRRRRHDSEDSDETYTPYTEQTQRRYKRRKPSVPLKDLIRELESQPKARRGRPPKRRESTVSSVCSVDDNSSSSTPNYKYRELRDKNNEASKRSRMNRKLKEQQMELLAVELEEKNKKLRVQADILEEMTKKLKNELMSAMLKK